MNDLKYLTVGMVYEIFDEAYTDMEEVSSQNSDSNVKGATQADMDAL